jgi:hypothetical protein
MRMPEESQPRVLQSLNLGMLLIRNRRLIPHLAFSLPCYCNHTMIFWNALA